MNQAIYDLAHFMNQVGAGPNSSKDLSYSDAYRAMECILTGRFHPVTLGGFLQSLRFKGETSEELAGFLDAARDLDLITCSTQRARVVDVAGNFDGKRKTPHISLAASLTAAGAGVPILMHGGTDIPTKRGVTEAHVLGPLGLAVDDDVALAASRLEKVGIAYLHHSAFTPSLYRLLEARQALGKRSFINAIEPLINPAGSRIHVGSFFHIGYGERVCRALTRSRAGFERVVLAQGIEGTGEVRLGRAHIAELRNGEISTSVIKSEALGLPGSPDDLEALGADPQLSADLTERLLKGDGAPPAFRSAVLLSAGVRLYASGEAHDIAEGVAKAEESLSKGFAAKALDDWRAFVPAKTPEPAPGPTDARPDSEQAAPPATGYAARIGWTGPMTTFPIFLVGLGRRTSIVVGGGKIAAEKVRGLLGGGAGRILVISPELGPEMRPLVADERVTHVARPFREGDLDGAFLVISATDDPEVNQRVFQSAESRGILAQVVDDPPRCTFIMPSVVRRGDLTIAISTGGASPALAVRLREKLQELIGVEYERFVALAGEIRPLIMDKIADPAVRKRLWYDIVDSSVLDLLRDGENGKAKSEALRLIEEAEASIRPAAAREAASL